MTDMESAPSADFDTLVIGGGPAGLATAIRRAVSGDRVLLVEQRDLPQTKCCGEFLHPSAVSELNLILSEPLAANPITRARIYAGGLLKEFSIAEPAMAIDRSRLSLALIAEAQRRGVEILTGHPAEISVTGRRSITVHVGQKDFSATRVVIAEGPASSTMRTFRGARTGGDFMYGFSTRVASDQRGLVALAALRGGYAGLCDVGAGTLNVAGLLSANAYRRLAPNHPYFGERILTEVPAWEGIIPRVCMASIIQVPATARIVTRRDIPNARILPVGDSAGMTETAFGDGIARALRQSRFLDNSIRMFPSDDEAAANAYYQKIRSDQHRPDRKILKTAAGLLRSPLLARMLLRYGASWLRQLTNTAVRPARTTR